MATEWEFDDAYRFGPVLGEMDEYLLGEGTHKRIWQVLGAHLITHEGVDGVHFAVWAPNAQRVSVVGDFNVWDGRRHPMRRRGATGVWETFIPGLKDGVSYKYEIRAGDGAVMPLKADPVGFGSEHPPANASVVRDIRPRGLAGRRTGWQRAPRRRTSTRRSRFMRCIWGRGSGRRATGCCPIWNWPNSWSTMSPTWGSPISN